MKKLIAFSLNLMLGNCLFGQKQIEKKWGTDEFDGAFSTAATADGGYIISGLTKSQGDTNGDIIVIKVSAHGDELWTLKYGGDELEGGNGIIQTHDGGYMVIGHTESFGAGDCDAFLMKVDKEGNKKWMQTYGDIGDDIAESAIELPEGGFVLIGNTEDFGAKDRDFYIIKTDAEGKAVWTKLYDKLGTDYGYSIVQTPDGGFLAAGSTKPSGTDLNDGWILRLNRDGDTLWTKTYGGAGDDRFYQIIPAIGGYVLAGYNSSNSLAREDGWLMKLDPEGKMLWQKNYGDTAYDGFYGVIQMPSGTLMACGNSKSTDSLGRGFIVTVDLNGTFISAEEYGASKTELKSIAVQGNNSFMASGYTAGMDQPESDLYYMEMDYAAGISEVETKDKLAVYPNPVKNMLHFNIENPAGAVMIIDMNGRIVMQQKLDAYSRAWDISSLPDGIYLLTLWTESEFAKAKFVKASR